MNHQCSDIKIIHQKEYSMTYLVTEQLSGFKYVVKKGKDNVFDEYLAHELFVGLRLRGTILPVYEYFVNDKEENVLIMEYINGYGGYELDKIDVLTNNQSRRWKYAWLHLIFSVALIIMILEDEKIQLNNFNLENIMIIYSLVKKRFKLIVLELETLTDYRNNLVFSSMVKNASPEERIRMGWSMKFSPGRDLNLFLGELLERYHNIMPNKLYDSIHPLLIKANKEFPYAIADGNRKTTGRKIMELIGAFMYPKGAPTY